MPITPDREKVAEIGGGMAGSSIVFLLIGTMLMPQDNDAFLFVALLMFFFGMTMAIVAVFGFLLPALHDYTEHHWRPLFTETIPAPEEYDIYGDDKAGDEEEGNEA